MNERLAKWHQKTSEDVCRILHSNAARGLSRRAARSRLGQYGPNTLFDTKKRSVWSFLRPLYTDPAWLLSLFFALISLLFGNIAGSIAALAMQALYTLFLLFYFRHTAVTERRISYSRIPMVHVLREGYLLTVSARRVVPGDILLLSEGDIVPCDCRILSSHALRVLTLMPGNDGKPLYRELPKNGDTVYSYGSDISAPQCENMLYGGSEIVSGTVRVIVVEIGSHSFLGAMTWFPIPKEQTERGRMTESVHHILPYLRLWGIFGIVLLPILTVVSLFTLPEGCDITTLFLTLCTFTAIASPALLGCLFRIIESGFFTHCMQTRPYANQSIVKNARAAERLCRTTDLVVLGHAALSDGIMHFDAAMLGDGTVIRESDAPQPLLQPLCEAFCLLSHAGSAVATEMLTDEDKDRDAQLISELCAVSDMDADALGVRLIRTEVMMAPDGYRAIEVTLRDRQFQLLFSQSGTIPKSCILYENGDTACVISPQMREQLQDFCRNAIQNGAKTITVFRRSASGGAVLLGILSVKEGFSVQLTQRLSELEALGIRTSILLPGEPEAAYRYAVAAGLADRVRFASPEAPHLTFGQLQSYGAYIGYAEKDILALIAELEKSGRRVAVFGGEALARELLCRTPLLISHSSAEFHKVFTEEISGAQLRGGGELDSACCAEVIRRRADVLVHRASPLEGGIVAIGELFKSIRANRCRMQVLLSVLLTSQISRMLFLSLLLFFGIGLPSAAVLWFASALAELWIALRLCDAEIKEENLKIYRPLSGKTIKAFLLRKTTWLHCIAVCVLALGIGFLLWYGVIGQGIALLIASPFMLLSVLATDWFAVLNKQILLAKRDILFPLLLFVLPMALLILLACLFPGFGALLGMCVM